MKTAGISQKKYKEFGLLQIVLAKIILVISLTLSILPLKSKAQNNSLIYSNASFAEKIYLQLDGKVFTTGNMVWFKCIVLNACDHVPSSLSRVLYVELITSEEHIQKKKLIKIENGIGQGFFFLDNDLLEGLYQIRAYTEWNKNFGTDFFFEEYIQVFAPQKEGGIKDPICNVTLIKEQTTKDRLEATFNPLLIDSLHKNKLTLFISVDNKKDTLQIKRGKDKNYKVVYNLEDESQFVTLQMQTTNQQKFSKTIILNEDFIDLQFFPESGELVHGLKSKVGFKALDANGQGKLIQGGIIDGQDSVITLFKSNILGMGSFELNSVDRTKTYFARMISQNEENQFLLYPLPQVAKVGNTLSVLKQNENILVTARSNYLGNDSIFLRFSVRGRIFYESKVGLTDNAIEISLLENQLPEGIISFTMFDKQKQPLAERLYFNERPESRINIALSTNKNKYAKRELTNLEIETSNNDGDPIKANLSLLVINKQQMGKLQGSRQNVLSWFLLDSELKGKIENPGYYFNTDSSMQKDLDALMITQGWRKYHYAKPFDEITFIPEKSLFVDGHVSGVFSKKKSKQAKLTMLTFGENQSAYSQVADSMGRFKFYLDDQYGEKINVLIQSSKETGKKMDYTVLLDKQESPQLSFNHVKTVEKLDSVVHVLVEKQMERKKIDKAFPLQSGNILIEEVEVTAYELTPNRKKVIDLIGEPEEIIDGKEIQSKEEKWSYGLYSVLLFNYSDRIRISTSSQGDMFAKVIGSDVTLILIDGKPVRTYNYRLIPYIPPSAVSSFEIYKCAKNFASLYLEVTGSFPPPDLMCGGVISIYTHAGKGIFGTTSPVGLMQASVPVFSAPREFYAPKYENIKADDWTKPDFRALIHWEPDLKTDSLGKASVSFYNADIGGDMVVVVEAVSETGEIGYQKIEYEVEGKGKEIFIAY